jgi:Carbohydrate phosphorylase
MRSACFENLGTNGIISFIRRDKHFSDRPEELPLLNVAGVEKFSSDRTIVEYAADIWKVGPCVVS